MQNVGEIGIVVSNAWANAYINNYSYIYASICFPYLPILSRLLLHDYPHNNDIIMVIIHKVTISLLIPLLNSSIYVEGNSTLII